jgi:hypothetical protein
MIDLLLLAVLGVVTWLVASDGPWNAAITFVASLLSGLFALNYFEPAAEFLSSTVMSGFDWQNRADIIALLGLFCLGVFVLRSIGEVLLPTYAEVHGYVHQAAQWGFGLLSGYVVMAVICVSLHVAPLPREYLGFTAERQNFFGMAPDRQWLAFTQYASEKSLRRSRGDGLPVIFDGARFPAIPGVGADEVWASFPIKYAARRQQYASGGAVTAQPASGVPANAPPPPQVPISSPSAGTGGF